MTDMETSPLQVTAQEAVEAIEKDIPVEAMVTEKEVEESTIPQGAPSLQAIMAYRTIYVLCTIGESGKLVALYYACVLISGRSPIWGIASVKTGKFVRYLGSRTQVENAYSHLTWRRMQAAWTLGNVQTPMEHEARIAHVKSQIEIEARPRRASADKSKTL